MYLLDLNVDYKTGLNMPARVSPEKDWHGKLQLERRLSS